MKFKPVPEQTAETFRMPFGKHKGRTFQEIIYENDGKYIDWMIGQDWKDHPEIAKALAEFAGTNSEQIERDFANQDRGMDDGDYSQD